jgi:hypothetical protein
MTKIELPHQDHYDVALRSEVRALNERFDPVRLAALGVEVKDGRRVELPVLCWRFAVEAEPFAMSLVPGGGRPGVVWQILVLDYLNAEHPRRPTGFRSFADFAGARTYLGVYEARVGERLARTVGADAEQFARAAERCGGIRGTQEPLSYLFRFFPLLELQVVRHEGDEDFPASCTVLFSDNAPDVLTLECMIVAAERLVAVLRGKTPCE